MEISFNDDQRLYVIPSGSGYSCLGYEVAIERQTKVALWLHRMDLMPTAQPGTLPAYLAYEAAMLEALAEFNRTGERCPTELTPQLVGLEGKRVEVVDRHGETRRFIVGKSMGWLPCHLEIARRTSRAGGAVTGEPFRSVKVLSK